MSVGVGASLTTPTSAASVLVRWMSQTHVCLSVFVPKVSLVCLSIYLSVCLPVRLPLSLSTCLSICICLSVFLFNCHCRLSNYLHVSVCLCFDLCLSNCPSSSLSIYLYRYLYLSICLSLWLYIHIHTRSTWYHIIYSNQLTMINDICKSTLKLVSK